jgi:hypothetical protein
MINRSGVLVAQRSRHTAIPLLNLFSDKKNVALKHLTPKIPDPKNK